MSPLPDIGPEDGPLGKNTRKKARTEFPDSSAADTDVGRSHTPPSDEDSDVDMFSAAKSKVDKELRAARAKEMKLDSQVPSVKKGVSKPKKKKADDLRKNVLKDALKKGIQSSQKVPSMPAPSQPVPSTSGTQKTKVIVPVQRFMSLFNCTSIMGNAENKV